MFRKFDDILLIKNTSLFYSSKKSEIDFSDFLRKNEGILIQRAILNLRKFRGSSVFKM